MRIQFDTLLAATRFTVLVSGIALPAQDPGGRLTDSQWVIRLKPAASTPVIGDTLVFRGGELRSIHFARQGFREAAYRTQPLDPGVGFTAELRGPGGNTVKWQGSIERGSIQGEVVVAIGETQAKHTFQGSEVPLLEGTRWWMTLTPEEQSESEPAVSVRLGFWNALATSSESPSPRFEAAKYALSMADGRYLLELRQNSEAAGERRWQLEIDGDRANGSVAWESPDGEVARYASSGVRMPRFAGTRWQVEVSTATGAAAACRFAFTRADAETTTLWGQEFPPAPYAVKLAEGKWRVQLAQRAATSRTRTWEGTLDGDRIRGVVTQRADGRTVEGKFVARRIPE